MSQFASTLYPQTNPSNTPEAIQTYIERNTRTSTGEA